jgi:hypothetical protein
LPADVTRAVEAKLRAAGDWPTDPRFTDAPSAASAENPR